MTIDLLQAPLTWILLTFLAIISIAMVGAMLSSRPAATPRIVVIIAGLAVAVWLLVVVGVPVAIALLEGVAP